MAYAALVSLLQTSEVILESEPYFLSCSTKNFESFRESIASLLSFLDDCSPICTPKINDLITKIRDAAYEAEDVLESLVATHILQKYGSDGSERFPKFPRSLEEVMKNIESVAKAVKGIQQDGSGLHKRVISTIAGSSGPASRCDNTMVALDNDLELRILEQLVGGRSALDIVPIVGMGGVGKTTLASIMFNSKLIKETFDIRGWVTISQTYDAHEIVLAILNGIGVSFDGHKNNGEQRLYQSLYGRKYLIVLDDVWSTKAWDDIKKSFPQNDNKSRIILTTRHSEVATYANSCSSCHEMKLLSDDSSWRLLCKEIFLHIDCPHDLVEIGKAIAKRCQGLPLAISVIAGHLRKESMSKEYWKYVAENLNSVLTTTDDLILEILSLSYDYLPHHLKACFLYIGLFLRRYNDIKIANVIKLWVAEGFVKPSGSNDCVEVVAMEYLKDLIDRNLIFVRHRGTREAPKYCGIHDLLKDVCTKEAQKEKFLRVLNGSKAFFIEESNYNRRLIVDPTFEGTRESYDEYLCEIIRAMPLIRSFVYRAGVSTSILGLISGLIKVLYVRGLEANEFPEQVLELVNLKFLQILMHVNQVPPSISRLWNLQTLIFSTVGKIPISLPLEVWEMPQLRHLQIDKFYLPEVVNFQVSEYSNTSGFKGLQTLSDVTNFRCTEEVLARILHLKKLKIEFSGDIDDWSFYCLNNLAHLCELESLTCKFWATSNETLVRNIIFPSSLKRLFLVSSKIPWEKISIVGMLPNLEVLKLEYDAFEGSLWESNDDEFRQLKYLLIEGSLTLREWRAEHYHFPRLRHLFLRLCLALEAIPCGIGEIPTLEIIELEGCGSSLVSSVKDMLGEDSEIILKASHILPEEDEEE